MPAFLFGSFGFFAFSSPVFFISQISHTTAGLTHGSLHTVSGPSHPVCTPRISQVKQKKKSVCVLLQTAPAVLLCRRNTPLGCIVFFFLLVLSYATPFRSTPLALSQIHLSSEGESLFFFQSSSFFYCNLKHPLRGVGTGSEIRRVQLPQAPVRSDGDFDT